MLEKEVEKKIRLYAESKGCLFEKFVSPGRRGVADRVVTAPGGAVGWLEVKAKGKEPTKLQALNLNKRKQMGCNAEWCDNVFDGCAFVDMLRLIGAAKLRKRSETETVKEDDWA